MKIDPGAELYNNANDTIKKIGTELDNFKQKPLASTDPINVRITRLRDQIKYLNETNKKLDKAISDIDKSYEGFFGFFRKIIDYAFKNKTPVSLAISEKKMILEQGQKLEEEWKKILQEKKQVNKPTPPAPPPEPPPTPPKPPAPPPEPPPTPPTPSTPPAPPPVTPPVPPPSPPPEPSILEEKPDAEMMAHFHQLAQSIRDSLHGMPNAEYSLTMIQELESSNTTAHLEKFIVNLETLRDIERDLKGIKANATEKQTIEAEKKASDWFKKIIEAKGDEFVKLAQEGKAAGYLDTYRSGLGESLVIHVAKFKNKEKELKHLLNIGVDLSVRGKIWGNTALIWAIANAANSNAMAIIEKSDKKVIDIASTSSTNANALQLAIAKGKRTIPLTYSNLDVIKALIAKGADVNAPNKQGNTPLHLAALRRDIGMVKALVDAGANKTAVNKEGNTPMALLESSYEDARNVMGYTANVYELDEKEFRESKDQCRALLAK